MRISSYNIVIRVDDNTNRYAILNGYTRALDIVNSDVYNYLKKLDMEVNLSDETKERMFCYDLLCCYIVA
jgi:hypothetical protein